MKGFRSLRGLVASKGTGRSGNALPGPQHQQVIDFLSEAGARITEMAYSMKAAKDDTFNQHDAFGWGVYFNKAIVNSGAVGEEKAHKPTTGRYKLKGRTEVMNSLRAYEPEEPGYVLVITNALWYSVIQELGWGGRKFPVISPILPEMEKLKGHIKGVEVTTDFIVIPTNG